MNTSLRENAFTNAVVTESVRWIEEAGPLDDAEAMRAAASASTDNRQRIDARARVLGERTGLKSELLRTQQWAPWVMLALVGVVVLAGLGAAGNVIGGDDRRINLMVALVSLLGLHALTLLMWLVGLVVPLGNFKTSLGGLWLLLTARVAGGERGQAPVLVRAATGLLSRARLMPWALGFVSHTIWAFSFAVVLATLLFALAFRNYTLNWETTILEPGFFVRSVQWLGIAPGWLGFPVPDAQTVLSPAASTAAGQRTWALWLTGCIVVYGLLPRALLALLCAGVWQTRKRALQPDLSMPYYRKLAARFDAQQPATVIDADPGRRRVGAPIGLSPGDTHDALWLIGFELPDELAWPPTNATARASHVVRIDGSAAQRGQALDALARARPARAVVACHAASSPDRGTERFLREVRAHCGECRLWLVGDEVAPGRWQRWIADAELVGIDLVSDANAALPEST